MSVDFAASLPNNESSVPSAILVKGTVSNPSSVKVYIAIIGLLRSNSQRTMPNLLSSVTTRPVELVVRCNKSKVKVVA